MALYIHVCCISGVAGVKDGCFAVGDFISVFVLLDYHITLIGKLYTNSLQRQEHVKLSTS